MESKEVIELVPGILFGEQITVTGKRVHSAKEWTDEERRQAKKRAARKRRQKGQNRG